MRHKRFFSTDNIKATRLEPGLSLSLPLYAELSSPHYVIAMNLLLMINKHNGKPSRCINRRNCLDGRGSLKGSWSLGVYIYRYTHIGSLMCRPWFFTSDTRGNNEKRTIQTYSRIWHTTLRVESCCVTRRERERRRKNSRRGAEIRFEIRKKISGLWECVASAKYYSSAPRRTHRLFMGFLFLFSARASKNYKATVVPEISVLLCDESPFFFSRKNRLFS